MIPIKGPKEIEGMRRACEAAAHVLNQLCELVQPGRTTGEIDAASEMIMAEAGVRSAFFGYKNFPGQICISVNEEVVHGIGGQRRLQYGDLVKLDVGVIREGWIGDNAISVPAGMIDADTERLCMVTEKILNDVIDLARPGARVGDLSAFIESQAVSHGYSVVREFVGHGVGRKLHEEPQIPNFGRAGTGPRLKPGMILAIEPMINRGAARVKVLADRWTVVTADGLPSAHFEHTVLVTENAPEILTWPRKTLLR